MTDPDLKLNVAKRLRPRIDLGLGNVAGYIPNEKAPRRWKKSTNNMLSSVPTWGGKHELKYGRYCVLSSVRRAGFLYTAILERETSVQDSLRTQFLIISFTGEELLFQVFRRFLSLSSVFSLFYLRFVFSDSEFVIRYNVVFRSGLILVWIFVCHWIYLIFACDLIVAVEIFNIMFSVRIWIWAWLEIFVGVMFCDWYMAFTWSLSLFLLSLVFL